MAGPWRGFLDEVVVWESMYLTRETALQVVASLNITEDQLLEDSCEISELDTELPRPERHLMSTYDDALKHLTDDQAWCREEPPEVPNGNVGDFAQPGHHPPTLTRASAWGLPHHRWG